LLVFHENQQVRIGAPISRPGRETPLAVSLIGPDDRRKHRGDPNRQMNKFSRSID